MQLPRLTPISYLKKIFRQGERSLSREEIVRRLQNAFQPVFEITADSAATIIERSLGESSPFTVGHSQAIIHYNGTIHPISHHLHRFLKENRAPASIEFLMRKLRQNRLLPINFTTELLSELLTGDLRFVQYEGDQSWYLGEWELANDTIYEFFYKNRLTEIRLHEIYIIMEKQLNLSRRKYIFCPHLDERFVLNKDMITIHRFEAEEYKKTSEEVAVTMQTLANASILDEVMENIKEAIRKLEQRNEQMKEQVVGYFKESNIEAISELMKEKDKNELAIDGLKKVMQQFEKSE